jgi:hypothetical protein
VSAQPNYRGLRDALRTFIPIWLQNRPNLRTGYSFLYVVALVCDIFITWCVQAVYAWFPGYSLGIPPGAGLDASSALPLLAASRGILQGPSESNASFAARLVPWLADWEAAGSSEILVSMLQAFIGGSPMVRVVDRAGNWVTIDPYGNITKTSAPWNWDEVLDWERDGWWSDLWIIVYPTQWEVTGAALSSLVPIWGNYNAATQVGTGHAVPPQYVDGILSILATWKGAHTFCAAIIWSYDSALFVPGAPVSGDPDGTWGRWAKLASGVLVPSRYGAANGLVRYWVPNEGG